MRYSLAAVVAVSLFLGAGKGQTAKPAQAPKPAVPPLARATVKFVDANLETSIVHVRDMKGNLLTLKGTSKTAVVRDLQPMQGEAFKPKPGEVLAVRYWPMKSGENILQAIMDARTGIILTDLTKDAITGKLLKVEYAKRAVTVQVPKAAPKRWTLAPNAIILANWKLAKLEGDPSIKPGAKGSPDNVLKSGVDVRVVLTKDKKVRGLMDVLSHNWVRLAKMYLDGRAAQGPPQPSQP